MKDTEDDTKKDIPCSWITKINIKCPDTQNNLQIQCNCYQNSNGIFFRNRKNILKFIWNLKGPQTTKATLRKKNKA